MVFLPLQSLKFIALYAPVVDKARDSIIQEMETMVVSGLADLVSCSSLQTLEAGEETCLTF